MSLSRRDFLKYGGATATAAATGAGVDLLPVEAAAVSLKIKEAKAFAGVCPYCAVGCGQLIYAKDNKIIDIEGNPELARDPAAAARIAFAFWDARACSPLADRISTRTPS